jgi:hypothetical protein
MKALLRITGLFLIAIAALFALFGAYILYEIVKAIIHL